MREVKPTQKPVPSSDIKDLFFNSGLLDIWATSLKHKYIDRFGNCHLTSAGMEWIFNELVTKFKIESEQALLAAGYAPAGTFQEGAEVVSRNGTVLWKLPDGDGDHYRWDGDLPKQVPAGSTPQSTGGISKGAWVSVGDASLRRDIKNGTGELIGIKQPYENTVDRTQRDKNAERISVLDFFVAGESDWTGAFQRASLASRDYGKEVFVPSGDYSISDSITLYDDGFAGGDSYYYKGNGSRFIGESLRTVITKTKVSSGAVNAIFVGEGTASKRGLRVTNMSLIDLTEGSAGIDMRQSVVNSEFSELFIQTRRIGVNVVQAFVNFKLTGVVVQGHDDEINYPLQNGITVGSPRGGTSIEIDRCHVGRTQGDAYVIGCSYAKIGVLSCDNIGGNNYTFLNFIGSIETLGAEWIDQAREQNGRFLVAKNQSRISINNIHMLNKRVTFGDFLFDLSQSQVHITQANATDNCVFNGAIAKLSESGSLDIGYFTQYKAEQFKEPVSHDVNTNTYFSLGNLAGTQYRGRVDTSIHQMLTIPNIKPQSSGCYRIMGTKSIARQVGCIGTVYSMRGLTSARAALMMDVACTGNGNLGTTANAIIKKVSDPVGSNLYNAWYEADIGTIRYMLLRMSDGESANMGEFFAGVTVGRDPNLFRIVTSADVTNIQASSIGVLIKE
ncbi:hypothetical protein AB7282_00545 [Providencia huaxiensis]|uniref:tail fiber/spike domain-containing protein n=1 Tax=Providencia huaxiensis TaxID=2027290 RepID=UPI0032DB44E7